MGSTPHGLRSLIVFFFAFISFACFYTSNIILGSLFLIIFILSYEAFFKFGYSEARKDSYECIKHLKSESDQVDLAIMNIKAGNLRRAAIEMVGLKRDFPQHAKSFEEARSILSKYLHNKPWWHF